MSETIVITARDAKAYLARIRKTDGLVGRLCDLRLSLRSSLYSARSGLGGMPGGKADPDRIGSVVARLDALERKIDDAVDELTAQKDDAFDRIRRIADPDEQAVLIARYLQLRSWRRIAMDMHMDERTVYRLHGRALSSFAEKMSVSGS